MTNNYERLLRELKELSSSVESKDVKDKFQVPKSVNEFEANIGKYKSGSLGEGGPLAGSEHLSLDISSVKPLLFADQNFLKELYSKAEPLVEISWIELKVSSKELEVGQLPMKNISEISGWEDRCGLTFGEGGTGKPVISLQSNSGISRRKKLVEELGLKITGPYNAGKFVNTKSEKGRDKIIEDLRKGFRMLNYSNKRFIEIQFPGKYPQKRMPAEKLPNFGEIYRIGLCSHISLGGGAANNINSLYFEYHYPYSDVWTKYPGKEETEMTISLARPPILLEPQVKVLNIYGITVK